MAHKYMKYEIYGLNIRYLGVEKCSIESICLVLVRFICNPKVSAAPTKPVRVSSKHQDLYGLSQTLSCGESFRLS